MCDGLTREDGAVYAGHRTAPMFFSDRTSSAALTVLFAETEKKPACFFISSNCFAVFLSLSIAIPPSTIPLHFARLDARRTNPLGVNPATIYAVPRQF